MYSPGLINPKSVPFCAPKSNMKEYYLRQMTTYFKGRVPFTIKSASTKETPKPIKDHMDTNAQGKDYWPP